MEVKPTLAWLRRDLRVTDHPALYTAAARGGPVIPVYVWAPEDEGNWSPGSAAKWWLERSLSAFDYSLRNLDSKLVLRRGPTAKTPGSYTHPRAHETREEFVCRLLLEKKLPLSSQLATATRL